MATLHNLGRPSGLPFSLLSQAIHRLSRHELEDLAQTLIDHLDELDGDPDLEDNNDREASDGDDRDIAWPEDGSPMGPTGNGVFGLSEDDEEDDPHGEGDHGGIVPKFGKDQTKRPTNWRIWDAR